MKTFENVAFQGDVMIQRIHELPDGLENISAEAGGYVVAHSETGHHHVIEARPDVRYCRLPDEMYEAYIVVSGDKPAVLEHHRSFDTHESLEIGPGSYRIRRQREHTPEGYRRAAD